MEKKDYLDISKASDIADLKERIIYRFFETLPGLISLGTLFGVLIFSWWQPVWIAIFIILFCLYYLLKILFLSFHQIVGYFQMRKHLKIDWMARLKKTKKWRNIYHLVVLPTYKEGIEVIAISLFVRIITLKHGGGI